MRNSIIDSEVWTTPPNVRHKINNYDFKKNPNKLKYLINSPVANIIFGTILSVGFLVAKEIYAPEATEPIIHPLLKIKIDLVNVLISAPFWAQITLASSKVIHNLSHNYLVDIKKTKKEIAAHKKEVQNIIKKEIKDLIKVKKEEANKEIEDLFKKSI